MKNDFSTTIVALTHQISRVEAHALPEYLSALSAVERIMASLRKKGIEVSHGKITELALFNPWTYRRLETQRIKKAMCLIDDVKAGKAKRPGASLERTYWRFVGKADEIFSRTTSLVGAVRECLIPLIDEEWEECLLRLDFKSCDFLDNAKDELIALAY